MPVHDAALDRFMLARMERFARLASAIQVQDIPQWRRLARSATLSCYRDCTAIGLEKQAREIIGRWGSGLVA